MKRKDVLSLEIGSVPCEPGELPMLAKVNIFEEDQAATLKTLEERKAALKLRAYQIKDHRGAGLKTEVGSKVHNCEKAIRDIDQSQNPEHYSYISDDAKRAASLERKTSLEAERDQAQTELDALNLEYEQINAQYTELEAESAPLEMLKEFQSTLDTYWPKIMAGESVFKTVTEIGPDIIVAVLAPLMEAFCNCREKLQPQLERNRKLDAKAIKADFDAFIEVGFNSQQAMELALARVKMNTMTSLLTLVSNSRK